MDDQRDANRQGDEQREGAERTASKGINPVQHSERGAGTTQTASKGINPVQHSERRQDDDTSGKDKGPGGSAGNG